MGSRAEEGIRKGQLALRISEKLYENLVSYELPEIHVYIHVYIHTVYIHACKKLITNAGCNISPRNLRLSNKKLSAG